MKIKLSPKQLKNLQDAIAREAQANQAFQIARNAAAEAANHRQSMMEVIFEAHGHEIPQDGSKLNLSADGYLTFGENGKASDNIKKRLKNAEAKSKGKVVHMEKSK